MPASVTTSTSCPGRSASSSGGTRAASLASKNDTIRPAGRDLEVGAQPAQPAGVLGGDHRRCRPAPSRSRAEASPGLPSGVAGQDHPPGVVPGHPTVPRAGTQ